MHRGGERLRYHRPSDRMAALEQLSAGHWPPGTAVCAERMLIGCTQEEKGAVNRYDPSHTPDPGEWLELDEQDRVDHVERFHLCAGVDLPNPTLHALLHVVVENQLAIQDAPIVRALARLRKQGLSRHEAVHAIGSLLAQLTYDLLNLKDTAHTSRARYYAAIERITAAQWRAGNVS